MNEIIVENIYLCLTTAAYETVPVRPILDELGNTIGSETLMDIFPNAPKYPLSDKVLCGIEVTSGSQIPEVTATAQAMGFTITWGDTPDDDVNILFRTDALTKKAELELFESTHYLDEFGVVQVIVVP